MDVCVVLRWYLYDKEFNHVFKTTPTIVDGTKIMGMDHFDENSLIKYDFADINLSILMF